MERRCAAQLAAEDPPTTAAGVRGSLLLKDGPYVKTDANDKGVIQHY